MMPMATAKRGAAIAALVFTLGASICAQGMNQTAATSTQKANEAALDPVEELQQATALAQSGNAAQGEKIVRSYLQDHPRSGEAHFLLGYVLFREIQDQARATAAREYAANARMAEFRDAHARASLAEYTAGARYHKPSAFDLKIVALDYVLLDDPADADKWLTRALEWNPNDWDGWYNLGRTKYSENRFEEAIQAFQECLKQDPKNVKAEDNLGLSYYGLGRANEALAAYKTAMDWEEQAVRSGQAVERNPQPFIDLGNVYLDQDRAQDALPLFLEATQIAPEDAKAHEGLGKTYTHLNELPKAQAELEKAVALVPNVASLHFMLGQVYRKEGMVDKAKAEFQRTTELNGTHSSPEKPIE
jgi:tetratricopeptide (TPR) repeat protein